MEVPLLFETAAFLLGLLFGSFLNVCISRLPKHESLWKPRSHCPNCHATIRWYDNIPLLSWVLLRARCRECKQPISWRYPAVELTLAIHFALLAKALLFALDWGRVVANNQASQIAPNMYVLRYQPILIAITLAILGFLLIGLLVMDWQTHTLPDAFTLSGTLIGFVLVCVQSAFLAEHQDEVILHGRNPLTSPGGVVDKGNVILTGPEHLILGRLLAIVTAAAVILIIRFVYLKLRGREGMGLGDAKLMAMLAAFLGFWPAMLAFFVGVVLCAGYALTLLVRRRATAVSRLPLGTFLCIGGLFAALFGRRVVEWYGGLF
jgi:leader peptidase (prepilin peptidase)/N-methyltransferase